VLTTHAGAIRYARQADRLPFSRQVKQSRTCNRVMRFPQLFYFTFFYQDRVFARDGPLFAICSPIIVSLGIVSNGNWV